VRRSGDLNCALAGISPTSLGVTRSSHLSSHIPLLFRIPFDFPSSVGCYMLQSIC
jgi:hypothetical protein